MASEEDRKRKDNSLSFWQKTKAAFTGGFDSEAASTKMLSNQNALTNQNAETPEAEAIRRRRMQYMGK